MYSRMDRSRSFHLSGSRVIRPRKEATMLVEIIAFMTSRTWICTAYGEV